MRKAMLSIVLTLWTACAVQAQSVTVAALGDSLTQGYGLPAEEGFVPQLSTWLAALETPVLETPVRIINAGVSGDTTAGGLARVAWTLSPDVDAMIVTLGGNDLLRGIDPGVVRANIEGILQGAEAAGVPVLLIGMQAPGNFGPEYKTQFDAIYPELAAQYGALYLESFFEGLGGAGANPAELRAYFQADGTHPNAQGVAKIVQAVGPKVVMLINEAGLQ